MTNEYLGKGLCATYGHLPTPRRNEVCLDCGATIKAAVSPLDAARTTLPA